MAAHLAKMLASRWPASPAPGSVPPVGWRHGSLRTARRESSERGRAFFPLAPPSTPKRRLGQSSPAAPKRCPRPRAVLAHIQQLGQDGHDPARPPRRPLRPAPGSWYKAKLRQ